MTVVTYSIVSYIGLTVMMTVVTYNIETVLLLLW